MPGPNGDSREHVSDLARRSLELHERLRHVLADQFGNEEISAVAGALMYEIVSLAATISDSREDARRLLADWLATAALQIDRFGLGKHP